MVSSPLKYSAYPFSIHLSYFSQNVSTYAIYSSLIPNTLMELNDETFREVLVSRVSYCKNTDLNNEDYKKVLKDFFEKYEDFKNIVKELRFLADIN